MARVGIFCQHSRHRRRRARVCQRGLWAAPDGSQRRHGSTLAASLSYFAFAALFAGLSLYLHRRFLAQVIGQLVLDFVVITVLVVSSGGVASGWVILFLLPLAGASLLLPSTLVFFVCAVAVLAILIDAGLRTLSVDGSDPLLFQAGLYGAALFAVTALLRALSSRLASQERLARSRGRDLQNQLAINRLVIAQMQQGVIVVDPATQVRANNRAARRMLGLEPSAQLTGVRLKDVPAASALAEAFIRWVDAGRSEGAWSNTVMAGADTAMSPLDRITHARTLCAADVGLRRGVRHLYRRRTRRRRPCPATEARRDGPPDGVDRA